VVTRRKPIGAVHKKEGWKETTIRTRKRKQGQGVWLFQACCPPFQTPDEAFWQYCNSDGSCHITVGLEVSRKRQPLPSESIVAPRKRWTHTSSGTVATQLDSDSEELVSDHGTATGKGQHVSKKSKTKHTAVDADQVLQQQFPLWSAKDDGGTGDCAFRAIARVLAFQQSKDISDEKIVSEASRLRTLTVGHLTKNKETFSSFWAFDPDSRPDQRDQLDELETFSDYIMAASRRNFWVDGLLLHALSHRLGRVIITFVWHPQDGAWQRHVLAPAFENHIAKGSKDTLPICLLLKGEHYRSLLPNTNDVAVPKEWFKSTPEIPRKVLRGAGKSTHSKSSKLSIPDSPQVSVASIRNWLRPRAAQAAPSVSALSFPPSPERRECTSQADGADISLPPSTPTAEARARTSSKDASVTKSPDLSLPKQTPEKNLSMIKHGEVGACPTSIFSFFSVQRLHGFRQVVTHVRS